MNHCEPSFLKHYFSMGLIIYFGKQLKIWEFWNVIQNITLVCLWEWYKIEKYGITSANFFKQIRTKSIEIHFLSKDKNIQKSIDISKNQRTLRLNRFLLVLLKKSVLILDST